ncbi:MAG: type II secretion system F family protein [Lentisphaerae bacterium]|nr:type II secretion system F family protein [Lentisphaerota bacterium]
MPKYKYTATDAQGEEKQGVIEAANQGSALARLKEMGVFASDISEVATKQAPRSSQASKAKAPPPRKAALKKNINLEIPFLSGRVTKKALVVVTRQIATLIDAGVPLLRSLQILHKQESNPAIRKLVQQLADSVEGGSTFADALSLRPKLFDKLFINMVKAGELGGNLEVSLNRLAEFMEKSEKLKNKVTSALIYPILVLVVAVAIVAFLLIKIVPQFTAIFEGLLEGAALPGITLFVVNSSRFVAQKFPLVVITLVGIFVATTLLGKTNQGRFLIDSIKLKIPILGRLQLLAGVARFTRTLGTLLNSGVQILQALMIVKETSGNEIIARAIQDVHDSVKEGESVAQPLELAKVFPSMVISMIAVGEETGRLPEMLAKIADSYDNEVDTAVEGMTRIIEPLLIVMLSVVVGTIVIAMFMPLIQIVQKMR